jgi:hypothetical protein
MGKIVIDGPLIRRVAMYLSLGYNCREISRICGVSNPSIYRALECIKAMRNICGDRITFQKLFGIRRGRSQGWVMDLKANGKELDELLDDVTGEKKISSKEE